MSPNLFQFFSTFWWGAIVSIRRCLNPSRRGPNPNDPRGGDLTLTIGDEIWMKEDCIKLAHHGLAIMFDASSRKYNIYESAHRGLRSARMRLQYPLQSADGIEWFWVKGWYVSGGFWCFWWYRVVSGEGWYFFWWFRVFLMVSSGFRWRVDVFLVF